MGNGETCEARHLLGSTSSGGPQLVDDTMPSARSLNEVTIAVSDGCTGPAYRIEIALVLMNS
jgi:hypothetical protein